MNLSFYAGGRRRKLSRRKVGGNFRIVFQHKGRVCAHSLGTTLEHVAKEKAREKIEAAINGDHETLRRTKMKSEYAPLESVCSLYIERFGRDARTKRTARGNVGALAKIIRLGNNTVSVVETRANVLTGGLIRKFETAEEQRIERDSLGNMLPESETRVRTSICSVVRQARSIFKPSHMNWYEHLVLPNLDDFRRQGVRPPDRPKPRPLDEGVMEAINSNAPALARTDPACYIAHLAFKFLGLRNGEIKAARRSWIVGARLGIIYRPEEGFKPKKKTERWIGVATGVLAQMDHYWVPSPDGDYLVPAANKTERQKIVDRRHSAWAGQWIRDRSKVSYELRRFAGSMVYRKTGKIEHVQQFLGHADLKTTMDWYWYLLDETPAIELEDCAPQFKVVA